MGYSHYWYRPHGHEDREAFRELGTDAKRIITTAREREGIEVAGWDGTGAPGFDEQSFRLNGCDPESCETFVWESRAWGWHYEGDPRAFGCVKTARNPYDAVVCAILIRAKLIYGDYLTVSSDGDWHAEWIPGRRLYLATFDTLAPWAFDQYLARWSA